MDYCEIILDSVRKVVTSEMAKELKSLTGSLVTAKVLELKDNDEYTVQEEGGRRLTATGDSNLNLSINDYVYLNGATIIAKKLDSSQVPVAINESLKDFISFEEKNISNGEYFSLTKPRECNRLLLSAIIDDEESANYGISLKVENDQGQIYGLDFSKLDIIGRIGKLKGSLQKQMYELKLGIIKKVFVSYDSKLYKSVTISLGSNADGVSSEMGLHINPIVAKEELKYTTNVYNQILEVSFPLEWKWIYVNENNVLCLEKTSRELMYYRYNEAYNMGDEYGGLNWERIAVENNTLSTDNFLSSPDETRFKAVLLNGATAITSNEIVFKNTKLTRDALISNIALKLKDGRNGNYPFYSPEGNLLKEFALESTVVREVEFTYVNIDQTRDINSLIKKVEWQVDLDKISLSNSMRQDINVRCSEPIVDSLGNQIITIDTTERVTGDTKPQPNWNKIEFFIKNQVELSDREDSIVCTVTLEGDEEPYVARIPLRFGTNTINGYAVTFELLAKDTQNLEFSAYAYKDYNLVCKIWDREGQKLAPGSDYTISADWYGHINSLSEDKQGVAFALNPINNEGRVELIQNESRSGWSDTSHIIQFTINIIKDTDKHQQIKMLYPLAVRSNANIYYNGPIEFVYDAAGRAVTSSLINTISFKDASGEDINPTSFALITADLYGVSNSWKPILSGNGKKRTLTVPSYYESKLNETANTYKCHIKFMFNDGTTDRYFSQPIVIYQNTQFSTYIDEWGGELTIDEDKNAVLSAAVVAGTKNKNNQFTGVIVGDVQRLQDSGDPIVDSGILGFQAGVPSFGLNTDGTAFLGKSGRGQIRFSGDSGDIVSGNYNGTDKNPQPTAGMKIDLDDGAIYSPGFELSNKGLIIHKQVDTSGDEVPKRTEIQYALNNDPDKIDAKSASWSTTTPTPTETNKYVWQRLVRYYSTGSVSESPVRLSGTDGEDADSVYRLSLDNDSDVVAIAPSGKAVSNFPIEVNATAYYGVDEATGDGVEITCTPEGSNNFQQVDYIIKNPPSTTLGGSGWVTTEIYAGYLVNADGTNTWGYYCYYGNVWHDIGSSWNTAWKGIISSYKLPVKKYIVVSTGRYFYLPSSGVTNGTWNGTTNWSYADGKIAYTYQNNKLSIGYCAEECSFKFKLLISGAEKDAETFKIKTITSDVDYDLLIDKTTINNTNTADGGEAILVRVQKRSKDGAVNLSSSDGTVKLYTRTSGNDTEVTNWSTGVKYYKTTEKITLVLKQTIDGTDFEWDIETIEFVKNGTDGKNGTNGENGKDGVPTGVVGKFEAQNGLNLQAWTTGGYSAGQTRTITTITDNNYWKSLKNGNYCYVIGEVSDQYSAKGVHMTVTSTVQITDYTNQKVLIISNQFSGSEANVTYENMFAAWPTNPDGTMQSGLIKGTYIDAQGKSQTSLLLNADFINTGALRVGSNSNKLPAREDCVFYADFARNDVKIGNWNVGQIKDSNGNLDGWWQTQTGGSSSDSHYEGSLYSFSTTNDKQYLTFLRHSNNGHVYGVRQKDGNNNTYKNIFSISNTGNVKMAGSIEMTGSIKLTGNITDWSALYNEGKSTITSSNWTSKGIHISKDYGIALADGNGGGTWIQTNGYLSAIGCYIAGTISAYNGQIGGADGWTISTGKLTTGDLGAVNSFHMYSSGSSGSKSIANSGNKTDWRLAISTGFGVDSSGKVYADDIISSTTTDGIKLTTRISQGIITLSYGNQITTKINAPSKQTTLDGHIIILSITGTTNGYLCYDTNDNERKVYFKPA